MNAPTVGTDVASYIAEVERLLDDLPHEDRLELLEDVREHVTEVAAEDEGSLADRLGPPGVYTAELRASAGLPPRVEPAELTATERLRRAVRATALGSLAESAPIRAVRGFMPELRPAWWVVRGYMAAVVIDALIFSPSASDGGLPWPRLDGSSVVGVLLVVVCVALSILAGRATTGRQRHGMVALFANVAVVALFAAVLPQVQDGPASVEMVQAAPFGFLQHDDGAPITTICAYDEDGTRLKDVQLVDQDGRPIVGAARPRLDLLQEKMRGDGGRFLREKLLTAPEGPRLEASECPNKLEDLRTRVEPVPPLPRKLRGMIVE
jgi:hypothetical protein